MKQKYFLALAILGVFLVSGCVGSGIENKIPTKNLPYDLKFDHKFVTEDSTGFSYPFVDGASVQVGVYKTETAVKTHYEKNKNYMIRNTEDFNNNDVNKLNNITLTFKEDTLIIEGLSVKHLQSKVGVTKDNKYYAHNVADIYLILYNDAVINVGAVEDLKRNTDTPKEYRAVGLEFTKIIIQNLKK